MDFPAFFLRDAQLVQALKVQPKFSRRPQEMRKSQSRITRESTFAIQDLG